MRGGGSPCPPGRPGGIGGCRPWSGAGRLGTAGAGRPAAGGGGGALEAAIAPPCCCGVGRLFAPPGLGGDNLENGNYVKL